MDAPGTSGFKEIAMASQIRPNRQECNDRWPVAGFTIRSDRESKRYEVAIAADPTLFQADAKSRRTTSNFYSSRASGLQPIDRGEAVYVLPPEVLARFVGNEKLFYALATYTNGDSTPQLSSLPSEASPYINLRGLSGRSLRRVGLLPSRQRAASAYGGGNELEWAGDMLMPGTQAAGPSPAETNGKSNGAAAAPATEAAAFEYRDGFGEMPPAPSQQATARAQADQCYSLNWDVQLIPQPTGRTCWAAAGAMVLGWYEGKSLSPEEIGTICGRSMTTGLSKNDRRKFASEIGLVAEGPQSYTPDALKSLLRTYGPLWVSVRVTGRGHAVVVTGMYSDGTEGGSDVYVRISDPWDRVVGSPGAPGKYLKTHNSGSRYILSWADFTAEYETRASTAPDGSVNAQILHAPEATTREPNYYRPEGYAMSAAYAPSVRAMTGISPDTNWGIDTQIVPEVPGASCWASAMSMVVGWRDFQSIDPTTIAGQASNPNDRASLAAAWDLEIVPPASYNALEMAQMLQAHGPLWVAARPAGDPHVFVIFGICGDGTPDGTFVYITDPWGNVPGSPRAPSSNPTPGQGSRYSLTYREFAGQYDPRGLTNAPDATHADVQLIYSRTIEGHESLPIDCSGLIPLSTPQGLRTAARAQSGESYTLNWDQVDLIPQPTDYSCWAAAAAMVLGWRAGDEPPLSAEKIAEYCGRSLSGDLPADDFRAFGQQMGLTAAPPQCYTPDGLRNLLENYGPVWVCVQLPESGHAIVVTGMYSDGAPDGSDTYVRITDPLDRVVGTPGAPGGYLNTHNTGSRYIMNWADFTAEYEGFANSAADGTVNAQILHSGGIGDKTPNRSGAAGYAMSVGHDPDPTLPAPPPPKPKSQAMDAAAVVSAIAGAIVPIVSEQGNIKWNLDQFRGIKHPNDIAPSSPAPFRDAKTIRLNKWPYIENFAKDQISAWFSVDFQCNGKSLGNVRITNTGTNQAFLQELHVEARIMDDNIVYPRNNPTYAALRIRFYYRFIRPVGADWIAVTDLQLFGDGDYESSSCWEQE